jgi:hypothetical protein
MTVAQRTYNLQDGYKDQQTAESISFHSQPEPAAVRITPKNIGSTFTIPDDFFDQGLISAIDYGTEEGFFQGESSPRSGTAGDIVAIYFNQSITPADEGGGQYGFNPNEEASGELLSQVLVLHDPLPMVISGTVVIDSPDFEAPNGLQDGLGYVEFYGSTFKKGPRIYSDFAMVQTRQWPIGPVAPFNGCDSMTTIVNQGTLGPQCRLITNSDFVYENEEGFRIPDAYPDGGRPVKIIEAIPIGEFHMDSGGKFPIWDVTDLEDCQKPVLASNVHLPTRSSPVSIPVGVDVRSATRLKRYINGIVNVTRGIDYDHGGDKQEVGLFYGLKILGIELPDSVRRVVNSMRIYRHQKLAEDGNYYGLRATVNSVKTDFNFNLGEALEDYYSNPDELLLMPHTPEQVVYMNDWGSVYVESEYESLFSRPYYWITLKPNGVLTGMEFPEVHAPNLKFLDGWLVNTFSYGRTGPVEYTIPSGIHYSGTVKHSVPAPPHHEGINIRNHRKNMASRISGTGFPYSTYSPPSTVQLAFGRAEEFNSGVTPALALNIDGSFFTEESDARNDLRDSITADNFQILQDLASGEYSRTATYTVSNSVDGFEIEEFDTSGIHFAWDWEVGVFDQAQMDPTTVPHILTPIDKSKVDGAYNYALNLATPINNTVRYIDEKFLQEPQKSTLNGNWQPTYTMILGYGAPASVGEAYTYKLEDIDIPNFILTDAENEVYNTWTGLFSYLIYGDIQGFKTAHGIPDSTDIGGETTEPEIGSGSSIGLGVFNWVVTQAEGGTGTLWYSSVISNSDPDGLGSRGFGVRLFRQEVPRYPDQAPNWGEPIWIDWERVGKNWIWDSPDIVSLRAAVSPRTVPYTDTDTTI